MVDGFVAFPCSVTAAPNVEVSLSERLSVENDKNESLCVSKRYSSRRGLSETACVSPQDIIIYSLVFTN